jgi:predicted ABC-type transport system involved in lysophospholipase L1 biosynthesis ATPase subunit
VSGCVAVAELRGVSKGYGRPGAGRVEVLRALDLTVLPGESVAIVGPSGSGKSTLLNILGTLDLPDAGEVWVEGREVERLGSGELARVRNRRIGLIFQLHHLLPHLGVLENVLVPALVSRDPAAPERARRLLERVGLGNRLDHRPAQLSGGERQRVAVVRALVNRPALLIADEPTGSLDRRSAESLADLLVELNREEGTALVVATHSPALAGRMGRALELLEGQLAPARLP